MRPLIPAVDEIDRWLAGARATGQWANFGHAWREAIQRLDQETGKYSVLVHNGTSAIELAARHVFKPGSRILIPDFTHAGTLQAVVRAGMIPVLGPVNKKTWTLDIAAMEANRRKYDGVIVVSPFGYYVDFELYDTFCKGFKKPVMYDLAGAWGMPIHATENACTFSLHATKNFSCGEGGIIAVSDPMLRERIRAATNFDTLPDRTVSSIDAGNYKVDEFKAAIVCAHLEQPKRIRDRIERKRAANRFYEDFLSEYCSPHYLYDHPESAPSLCVLAGVPASNLEFANRQLGVEFKQYYKLLSRMYDLKGVDRIGESDAYFERCCALPSDATEDELDWIVDVLRKFIKSSGGLE